jgi:hypothetical protein
MDMVNGRELVVLALWTVSSGCGISATPAVQSPTVSTSTPQAVQSLVANPSPVTAQNQTGIPTAVRVLSTDPRDVVLRPADLPGGFFVTIDDSAADLALPASTRTEPPTPPGRGIGHHVVLASAGGRDPDGVLSVASTAIRYETTRDAVAWFAYEVQSVSATQTFALLVGGPMFGDESHGWRYAIDRVIVDEILVRRRNFLLSTVVVHNPGPDAPDIALHYLKLLRAKLPD